MTSSSASSSTSSEQALKNRIKEIIEVIENCRSTKWLQELLHFVYHGKGSVSLATSGGAGGSAAAAGGAASTKLKSPSLRKKQQAAQRIIATELSMQIVDGIVLIVDESMSDNADEEEAGGANRRACACLQALDVFANENPQLLVKHVETLGVYLNPAEGSREKESQLQILISIFMRALPLIKRPDPSYLAKLAIQLARLVKKDASKVMEKASLCLGHVASMVSGQLQKKDARRTIRKLFVQLFSKLQEMRGKKGKMFTFGGQGTKLVGRALRGCGMLIRAYDFDSQEEKDRAGGVLVTQVESPGKGKDGAAAVHVLLRPGNVAHAT